LNTPGAENSYLWWKHGVIYQIYPRSFSDSDGDGIGDLKGLISRLDYLADLGIDGVWLSPIFPSPMKDFGYDISNYREIDPVFGTMKSFRLLIDEARSRGIRIILDMVFNHSSDQHPWFIESRSSRENVKKD
jgi:alpha-glucosidase